MTTAECGGIYMHVLAQLVSSKSSEKIATIQPIEAKLLKIEDPRVSAYMPLLYSTILLLHEL